MFGKKFRNVLVVLFLVGLGTYGGFVYGQSRQFMSRKVGEKADISLLWQVWDRLEKVYLKPENIQIKKMVYGAISGMTSSLGDPYTTFLPPSDNDRTKEDLMGEFGGVGIQLGYIEKTLAAMSALPNQPAVKAGIRSGDLILRIKDDKKKVDRDTNGISLDEAVNLIRGPKGTPVTLTIFREGSKQTQDITIVRDVIVVPSVEYVEVEKDPSVAVIRVSKFGEKTLEEWDQAVAKVNSKKINKVILDLRDDPGGYLQRAVDLASEFIASGVIVQQRDRQKTETFGVNHSGKLVGVKLVVLVNKGSASASEILAGALRERVAAKLVGEKTFGKGTVQEAEDFPGGGGLHVTIAEWLLPSGRNIHGNGLDPDVEVKDNLDTKADEQLEKAVEVINE